MRRAIYLTTFLLMASVFTQAAFKEIQGAGALTYGIFECTEITDSGDYVLTNDISGAQATGACIIITASNVNLDCKGFTVSDTKEYNTGIRVDGNDNTVTNCVSNNNYYGFRVEGDLNSFSSNTANNNNGAGFKVSGDSNSFSSNTANNNGAGFKVSGDSNSFSSNTANNNDYGFSVLGGTITSFTSNTANDNINGVYINGGGRNSFTSNTITNNKKKGVYLYSSGYNLFEGNEISGNGKDKTAGEGNIVIPSDAFGVTTDVFKNNKISDGCGLWQAKTGASVTLEGNNFCDSGSTRTCADGYKISCIGGQVVDGGRNAFLSGVVSPSCSNLRSEVTCPSSNRNAARAPSDGQQTPSYGDAWLPVFALLGVLALGGFMWWHAKKK